MAKREKLTVNLPRGQVISESEFRKGIQALKRHGLLKSDTDVAKIKPTRWFRRLYERNYGLIAGTDTTVKVSPSLAAKWKKLGAKVTPNNRVVQKYIPETRLRERRGEIVRYNTTTKTGGAKKFKLTSRLSKVKYDTMDEFLDALRDSSDDLDKKLGPNEKIAFRYRGNNSLHVFPNWQAMLDYLSHYEGNELDDAIDQVEFLTTTSDSLPRNRKIVRPPRVITYAERQKMVEKQGRMGRAIERAKNRYSKQRYRARQDPELLRKLWRDQKKAYRAELKKTEQVANRADKLAERLNKAGQKLLDRTRK